MAYSHGLGSKLLILMLAVCLSTGPLEAQGASTNALPSGCWVCGEFGPYGLLECGSGPVGYWNCTNGYPGCTYSSPGCGGGASAPLSPDGSLRYAGSSYGSPGALGSPVTDMLIRRPCDDVVITRVQTSEARDRVRKDSAILVL